MAILKGLIKIEGTLEDLTFYEGKTATSFAPKAVSVKSVFKATRRLYERAKTRTNLGWQQPQVKHFGARSPDYFVILKTTACLQDL